MNYDDDQFEIIDSQYELIESVRIADPSPQKASLNYEVTIRPTKNEVDLNIMENQYYLFEVKKDGEPYKTVERRFSEFELIFEILSRKEGGFIFPAFPENGIFAYMKSKVSISKDEAFIERRIKIITRFFNITLNTPLFDPEFCPEMQEFLSQGKEFQARKQIQKGNKGYFNLSWNKIKTYFVMSKENKYSEFQARLVALKTSLEMIYGRCRQLIDCLREEQIENNKFLNNSLSIEMIKGYIKMIEQHDQEQHANLTALEDLQFLLFCENEDLQMVYRIFEKINKLKDDEDNYAQLKNVEEGLEDRLEDFLDLKIKARRENELELRDIIDRIKKVGRMGS